MSHKKDLNQKKKAQKFLEKNNLLSPCTDFSASESQLGRSPGIPNHFGDVKGVPNEFLRPSELSKDLPISQKANCKKFATSTRIENELGRRYPGGIRCVSMVTQREEIPRDEDGIPLLFGRSEEETSSSSRGVVNTGQLVQCEQEDETLGPVHSVFEYTHPGVANFANGMLAAPALAVPASFSSGMGRVGMNVPGNFMDLTCEGDNSVLPSPIYHVVGDRYSGSMVLHEDAVPESCHYLGMGTRQIPIDADTPPESPKKITLTGHKHERGSQSSGSERPVPKRNTGVLIEAPPPAYVESTQGSNNGFVPPTNLVGHNPENDMTVWWEWSASVDQRISQLFELSATPNCTNDIEIDPNEAYYEFHKSAEKMLDNFRLESSAKQCQLEDHASRLGEQLQIMVEEKMTQLMSQINLGNHTRETMREFVTTGEWFNLITWADVVKQYLNPP